MVFALEWSAGKTITYTIHVSEAVAPTAITITGANEVTQFKNINLTYTLTPAGAEGTVQWSSSNEDILTVDSSGKVTGLRRGQATVTANVYSGQSLLCSATKTIQVVEDTTVTGESATVYYLLDPTKDANSNDTGNWDRHMELRKSMLPEQLGQGARTVLIMLIKEL